MDTPLSLLERLQRRPDQEAWRQLDGIYRPLVRSWLLRDASLAQDVDDLTQEILGAVFRDLPSFQRRRAGSFRAWLRAITAHRVQAHYRKRQSLPRAGPLDDLADEGSDLARRWDREHNEHVVRELLRLVAAEFGETDVRAFRRQVFDEVPAADVARELGVPVNVVYLAKSRILARLRCLGKDLLD